MKSTVSVRSISGAATKAMKCHVMGCLEDESLDATNDLKHEKSAQKIASNITNAATSAKNKSTVHVSGSTVRNDKYDRKGKEVDVILKKKLNDKNLSFIYNVNINPRMLNKSGFHLNEYGTTQLIIFGTI